MSIGFPVKLKQNYIDLTVLEKDPQLLFLQRQYQMPGISPGRFVSPARAWLHLPAAGRASRWEGRRGAGATGEPRGEPGQGRVQGAGPARSQGELALGPAPTRGTPNAAFLLV